MKIVIINTICSKGSVGRICADLYEELDRAGDEPYMIAGRGKLPPYMRGRVTGSAPDFFCHVMKNFFLGGAGFGSAGATKKLIAYLEKTDPDLIHLHNIHGFYLQTELFFDYLKKSKKPVIWTLHDCWSFTGHCAYYDFERCEKWSEQGGCHDCRIHAKAYPYALFKDNTKKNFKRKKEAYTNVPNLTIVVPSRWLAGEVGRSFLKDYPVRVIPNGINLEIFKPLDKKQEKKRKQQMAGYRHRTVLGVANYWEERKGLAYLERLVDDLPSNYTVEIVGLNKPQVTVIRKKHPTARLVAMERTANPELLASIYRTADVYVNPTLEDNFPTTNIEALACGTPVVTFDTGGSSESLTEKCGIVVEKGNYDALRQAVIDVCENAPFAGDDCRERAGEFEKAAFTRKYVELYREMVYNH